MSWWHLMAMVAQTSQVSKRVFLSLLISPCCATTWHVDPWHICVVLNSCVPRIFVPQMLFLSLCCLVFWNLALRNPNMDVVMASDGNGCTDFPSQQKGFLKLADISMLCDNMTRWPLTHLCIPKQLCPKNLCATNVVSVGLVFVFWNLALRNPNMDVLMAFDGNGCTDFPSQQKSFLKFADISMLCDNMTRWPLTHLCSPKQLCPKNLCATNVVSVGLVFVFWNLALRNPNMDVLMASDGNGCTDFSGPHSCSNSLGVFWCFRSLANPWKNVTFSN